MDAAMMQPAFMPWQGYFELIHMSKIFIFLDDFQFSVQSYHQRNRLFTDTGRTGWYTVPVCSESFKPPLNRAKIDESTGWRDRLWKRLETNYLKADYYEIIGPKIKQWLFTVTDSLAQQNISFIKLVCDLLKIQREFRFSSKYPTPAKRSQRVVELLRWSNASRYFSARGSFNYMLEDNVFPVEGIEVLFQNFIPRPYKQVGSPSDFVPSLSVLDALMNIGPEKTADLIREGTKKWLTWQEETQKMHKEKEFLHA